MSTQTEEMPVEQATQTSRDEESQTVEVVEKAVQPCAVAETQTPAKCDEQQDEEQFFISTLLEIVGKLMEQADIATESKYWKESVEKFNYVVVKMSESVYPMKRAPRRSTRYQNRMQESSCRGSSVRGRAVNSSSEERIQYTE